MKKILLILLINISLMSYGKSITSEQLKNRNDVYYEINKETPYTGKVIDYYENGKIKEKSNFKGGRPNGEFIIYYENGEIEIKGNFKDGEPNGEWITYYENGTISAKEDYKNGVKTK